MARQGVVPAKEPRHVQPEFSREGTDKGLSEKERDGRLFPDDAVQDRFAAARGVLAPSWRLKITGI
jgi:hypothetical protein